MASIWVLSSTCRSREMSSADVAVGNATTTRAMTSDTITVWMSLTKGITAVAVAQMWEQGQIEIDDPVCSHLPEFGAGGKGCLTFRHLLTHTGVESDPWTSRGRNLHGTRSSPPSAMHPCETTGCRGGKRDMTWRMPGSCLPRSFHARAARYSTDTCASGDFRTARYAQLQPLDGFIDVPGEQKDRIGLMYDTAGGAPEPSHYSVDLQRTIGQCVPGGSGRGPARELGRISTRCCSGKARSKGSNCFFPRPLKRLPPAIEPA